MSRNYKIVTEPAIEPVSLADAKTHARIETSDDDDDLNAYITVARKYAERFAGRQFITATWDLFLASFPTEIRVPIPPLQSITSIKYVDTAGVEQTLASSVYQVDTNSEPGRVKEAYAQSWPATRDVYNAVTVRFAAGYGAAASDVDPRYIQAIKMLVAHWYNTREAAVADVRLIADVPFAVKALLGQERILTF